MKSQKKFVTIIMNTFKISVAAVLAIICAKALKLDFAVSAGIVAILSVQPTKKETLKTALARLLAFAAALVISIILFNLLGFTVPVFFIYLAVFILICQWRGWLSAMAMDSGITTRNFWRVVNHKYQVHQHRED